MSLLSFQLLDTKSTDRKLTLLHYIANVVKEKYAQVSLFYNELHYVEKAAAGESTATRTPLTFYRSATVGRPFIPPLLVLAVSLENVLLDVKELNRGMELTKREYSMHGHNTMLKDFIAHNESKLKKLQDDAKIAQVTRARIAAQRGLQSRLFKLSECLLSESTVCLSSDRTPSTRR